MDPSSRSTSIIRRVGRGRVGKPLFDELGQPTKYLQSVMYAFQDLKPGIETTKTVHRPVFLELKLIEPMEIQVGFDDGTPAQLCRPLQLSTRRS